jgi:hypothetical protein
VIAQRIDRARELHRLHGQQLLAHQKIRACLERYRRALAVTDELMHRTGVRAACARCAAEVPGGCCFDGMDQGYDPVHLLINLLLGSPLPERAIVDGCCHFVGAEGCRIVACHPYCIDYFCGPLKQALGRACLDHLQRVVEAQITLGWDVERAVRLFLQTRSSGGR